jgi:hypothetical protein
MIGDLIRGHTLICLSIIKLSDALLMQLPKVGVKNSSDIQPQTASFCKQCRRIASFKHLVDMPVIDATASGQGRKDVTSGALNTHREERTPSPQ